MSILMDAAELIEAINDDAEAFDVRFTLHDIEEDEDDTPDCVDFMNANARRFWSGGEVKDA